MAHLVEATADAEDVDPGFAWIWRAWQRLSLDRRLVGVGLSGVMPQRIPWTTLAAWCEWHGHSAEDLDLLDRCTVAMDRVFIEWWQERARQNTPNTGAPP